MITEHIEESHMAGWEWAAARVGLTVEQLAKQHLDQLGASFDRQAQEALFAVALQLPTSARAELKGKVLELAAASDISVEGA